MRYFLFCLLLCSLGIANLSAQSVQQARAGAREGPSPVVGTRRAGWRATHWWLVPEARATREHEDMAKLSINSAIGSLCCRDQPFVYSLRSSGQLDDIPLEGKSRTPVPLGNGDEIYDYITARQLLTLESTRPIWEEIMAIEYLRLAQARDLICEIVPQKSIRQCRTDCWLVSTSKKKAADVRKIIEAQTFKTIQRRTPFTPTPAPEHLTDDAPFRIINLSDPEKLERHTLKLTYSPMSEKAAPMEPVLVPAAQVRRGS